MNLSPVHLSSQPMHRDESERIRRREQSTYTRSLSFDENTLSSVENHRTESEQSASNLVEYLAEEKKKTTKKDDDDDDDRRQPEPIASFHQCSPCSRSFASEYGLDHHTAMHHPTQAILCLDCHTRFRSHRALKMHRQRYHSLSVPTTSNYDHLSSYLVSPFSSGQFPFICKNAAEQGRLPLGHLTSKLFLCTLCNTSFSCSRTLTCHRLQRHEQYEHGPCKSLLHDMIVHIEKDARTEEDEMELALSQQASQFGLVNRQLATETRRLKQEQHRLIFPPCEHQSRTCANLCLQHLSSYDRTIRDHSYQIVTLPKGNPFAQGSIVSNLANRLFGNDSIASKEAAMGSSQKRKSTKRIESLSQPSTVFGSTPTTLVLTSPKNNDRHTRASSSSITALKRRASPTIIVSVERPSQKRRRHRDETSSEDAAGSTSQQPKQRQASSGSIEYVHTLDTDPSAVPLRDDIENFTLKSEPLDPETVIYRSPPTVKRSIAPSPPSNAEEHIRVRCKVCGDILEGRRRFSEHVMNIHSHLLQKNIPNSKQQRHQRTAVVR